MSLSYLLSDNEIERDAFLAGFRAMMDIAAHTLPDELGSMLARRDEDWILALCAQEQERSNVEQKIVTHTVLEHYRVDRAEFRGFLLNRNRVNDYGQDIDLRGKPCSREPYPHVRYEGNDGVIYREAYDELSPSEQDKYDIVPYLRLRSILPHNAHIKRVDVYEADIIGELIRRILPEEPPVVLELYRQATIYADDDNNVMWHYDCAVREVLDQLEAENSQQKGKHDTDDYDEDEFDDDFEDDYEEDEAETDEGDGSEEDEIDEDDFEEAEFDPADLSSDNLN